MTVTLIAARPGEFQALVAWTLAIISVPELICGSYCRSERRLVGIIVAAILAVVESGDAEDASHVEVAVQFKPKYADSFNVA